MSLQLRMGGEFEFEPDSLRRSQEFASPAQRAANCLWTDTGRSALLIAAQDILRRGGCPIAWLPAFCCASVGRVFLQAGFVLHFYSASELHGRPGLEAAPRPGETFLYVHYFGRLNRQRLEQAAHWRRSGIFVIEDAVQAAFTDEVGAYGDYCITSIRKWSIQPDGAMLGSSHPVHAVLSAADEAFVSARMMAKILRGANQAADRFLPLINESEALLDTRNVIPKEPSWLGRHLMRCTDFARIATCRRNNHRALSAALEHSWRLGLTPLSFELEPQEVPLGMPVIVANGRREGLRRFLTEHAVYCAVHWPLPHIPQDVEFAADQRLAAEILTLPIDQRMTVAHVEHLASLIHRFLTDSA